MYVVARKDFWQEKGWLDLLSNEGSVDAQCPGDLALSFNWQPAAVTGPRGASEMCGQTLEDSVGEYLR